MTDKPKEKIEKENIIPEKFLDKETKEIKTQELAKAYKALEKKLSSKSKKENDNILETALKEEKKAPKDFAIELKNDLMNIDQQLNKELIEKGFSKEQIQIVYDIIADKVIPEVEELILQIKTNDDLEKLEEHFGGEENFDRISKQLLSFGQKHLQRDVLDTLCASFNGVLTLYKMMQDETGNLDFINSDNKEEFANNEKSLKKMMENPKYWRDRDPEYIKKISQGFKKIYQDA